MSESGANVGSKQPIMNSKQTTNKHYLTYIFLGLSIVGLLISIFLGNKNTHDENNGKANAIIYGYSMIIFSIIGLILIQFAINNNTTKNIFEFLKNIMTNSLPSIFLVVLLLWIVNLNVSFYKKINLGHVAEEYKLFFISSAILTFFQMGLVFQSMVQSLNIITLNKNHFINKFFNTFSIILLILNGIFVSMMQIILKYYSTDG